MDQQSPEKPGFRGSFPESDCTVNPIEVDDILMGHPKIRETCSMRVPDESGNPAIKVFIVMNRGEILTEQEVTDFFHERLPGKKLGAMVEFVDSLPRSPMGKILMGDLLERGNEKTKK
jgi:acyl-CoA synthetase (AMP-forming)/AMP-acid ligase II